MWEQDCQEKIQTKRDMINRGRGVLIVLFNLCQLPLFVCDHHFCQNLYYFMHLHAFLAQSLA